MYDLNKWCNMQQLQSINQFIILSGNCYPNSHLLWLTTQCVTQPLLSVASVLARSEQWAGAGELRDQFLRCYDTLQHRWRSVSVAVRHWSSEHEMRWALSTCETRPRPVTMWLELSRVCRHTPAVTGSLTVILLILQTLQNAAGHWMSAASDPLSTVSYLSDHSHFTGQ